MAAIAVTSSLIAGLLLALCRISRFPLLRYPAAFFVEVIRALPVLLIIFFTFFGAAWPGWAWAPSARGALGLAIYTSAINAEIVRAGITSIGRGQHEAARSLGLTYVQTMRYVVLPQALRASCPPGGPDHHPGQGHLAGRRDRGAGADPPGPDHLPGGVQPPVAVRRRLHLLSSTTPSPASPGAGELAAGTGAAALRGPKRGPAERWSHR